MRVLVQKWGNSLALRIPRAFAAETSLNPGSEVDLTVEDGRLVITPVGPSTYSLEELLSRVSDSNLHGELDTGGSVGSEVW